MNNSIAAIEQEFFSDFPRNICPALDLAKMKVTNLRHRCKHDFIKPIKRLNECKETRTKLKIEIEKFCPFLHDSVREKIKRPSNYLFSKERLNSIKHL